MPDNLTGPVTQNAVAALLPDQTLRDTMIKGFGARRRAGTPSYFLQTRCRGRLRWYTIGTHGSPWTPATARKEALRLVTLIAAGTDPATVKRAARKATDFREASVRFLDEYGPKLKPRTREEYERLITRTLVPVFGRRIVGDITHGDVAAFHARLADTKAKANFALAVLSKVLSWAQECGIAPENSNPCRHVKKFRQDFRQRFLSDAELDRLCAALDHHDAVGTFRPHIIAAIRLLLLTGCRYSEILTLQWQHVDFQRGLLLLPDSKTGAKTVWLNDAAKAVLAAVPRLPDNPFVIVGHRSGSHLVNLQKPWRRIRADAGIADMRIHDLRHSFASMAAANGASLLLIGKLLGHAQPQTTARYAHLVADPVRDVTQNIGARIGKSMRLPDGRDPGT